MSKASKATSKISPDHDLITACVAYCAHMGEESGAFLGDPDGNCIYAERIAELARIKTKKALRIVAAAPAQTMVGLDAKARTASVVLSNMSGHANDYEEAFLSSLVADVRRLIQPRVEAEWRTTRETAKGGAA